MAPMPHTMGSRMTATPSAKRPVNAARRQRGTRRVAARYVGNRETMQHGAKSARTPPRNAVSSELPYTSVCILEVLSVALAAGGAGVRPLLQQAPQLAFGDPAEPHEPAV